MNNSKTYLLTLFILILGIKSRSLAQINDPVGYFYTYEGDRIDGYIGSDISVNSDFTIEKIRSNEFCYGQYTSTSGELFNGYLKFNPTTNYFRFKKNLQDKEEKVRAINCRSVFLQKDTFEVFADFELQGRRFSSTNYSSEFILKFLSFNGYNFYTYTSYLNKPITYYFYQDPKTSSDLINFPKKETEFIRVAANVFQQSPWLVQAIEEGKYTEENILEVIMLYRYDQAWKRNHRILLDHKLQEVYTLNEADSYMEIQELNSDYQKINYYDLEGNLQYSGAFKNIYPFKEEGINTWYHLNGNKRKEIDFKDGEIIKTTYYSSEGKVAFISEQDSFGDEIFQVVYSQNGENILEKEGPQSIFLDDPIRDVKLQFTFEDHELINVNYTDNSNKKYYLKADKDVKIRGVKVALSYIEKGFIYPHSSFNKGIDGTIYLAYKIDEDGNTSNLKILNGINAEIDQAILSQFIAYGDYLNWKPAKENKENVASEVVIPVILTLRSNNPITNYHYNWFFMHNHMMMNNLNHIQPPPMPNASFGR